ncbi:MAG: hypothetical protein DI565_20015 [Ancylobacter novellus]|uniref:Uncharacterized protein n=1 Tax=Ancylobacter novellus TaxID=921 RepID=A0A2W5LYS2_ANCNO|nr:MAG: hypothetical protein DI565_20015 [Ancylobacter novellus]
MTRVFIANFGRENYAWPECLKRGSVATMNSVGSHRFWTAGDREGFIDYQVRTEKTAAGITPTRPVASRWFNLMTIISETAGDVWIHKDKDQIWWTISRSDPPDIFLDVDPTRTDGQQVYICHKPCEPWSDKTRKGNKLIWQSLHAKAKDFLTTESTLQQLSNDYAAYALAMIDSDDLSPWHGRPEWATKAKNAKSNPGLVYNSKQNSIWEMADQAIATAAKANGQVVEKTVKIKDFNFASKDACMAYLKKLLEAQGEVCALTGLKLQFSGDCDDKEMLCSLDRIDSSGHYEEGNLQIVCRFANRWKSSGVDEEFRRLIAVVRGSVEL